jgi:hypothetical protein
LPEAEKGQARDHAVEAYFKQAKNTEAERRACEIRLRAERKAGQLLAKMEKAKGGQPYQSGGTMGSPKTLKALGVSPDQSSRWQALAGVPEEDFEAAPEHEPARHGRSEACGQALRRPERCANWSTVTNRCSPST